MTTDKERLASLMGYLVGKSGMGSTALSEAITDRIEAMTDEQAGKALSDIGQQPQVPHPTR